MVDGVLRLFGSPARPALALFVLLASTRLVAQTLTVHGHVGDESGAIIPGAEVVLSGGSGVVRKTRSGDDGTYTFSGLSPGDYTIRASAPQLVLREPVAVTLRTGTETVNLVLQVFLEDQKVNVGDTAGTQVSLDPATNASARVLRGADLDALSDNPNDLAADLAAVAGPAAGPGGGTVLVDGFSRGELPAKSSIREVRINQNPFSPEYDKFGMGRIEIFTKPGTDKFHADLGYNFADDRLNSRNPYAGPKAPFHLHELRENLSGALGKRASFNLTVTREWVDNGNAVNTVILDPQTLAITPFTGTPVAELRRTVLSPRVDYALNKNNTLSVRYAYNRDIVRNAGTGGFNLESRGYHNDALSQTLQVSETAVIGTQVLNELRFQYFRPIVAAQANLPESAVQVLDSFQGGGNPLGNSRDVQNNFELQNYTSVLRGEHTLRFGVRLRGDTDVNSSPQNYRGTFTFAGGVGPQLDPNSQPVLDTSGQPVLIRISSIENYRRTLRFLQMGLTGAQIRQLGGGASQFSINAGQPEISGGQTDAGVFLGDDWRVRPRVTLSLGLRYEVQTNIHDWTDFAPRVGVAWSPGGKGKSQPKSVVRAGFGIFYDRFGLGNVLTAERYSGTLQQQYIVSNPDFFPLVPPPGTLTGPLPSSTLQMVSPSMRAPYLMQTAVSYERQVPLRTTIALTYANTHGLHMLRSRNINAPYPGTYDREVPGSGVYPYGHSGLVVLMESSGIYNQNQLLVTVNSKVNDNLSLIGSYAYGKAMSNTDSLATFPANPYSMQGEYGPALIDIRHRVSLTGTVGMKWGIRFNPLLTANTGPPFDITTGQDVYGSTLFNARPGFASDPARPGVVRTAYGLLDPSPDPGQARVPRNYGRGPGQIVLNMRVSRTFNFGSREGHAPLSTNAGGVSSGGGRGTANRRYSLVASLQIRNLTNHNNPGAIIGNIASPLFGQANQPAGSGNAIFAENANNRRLEAQIRLTF